MPERKLNRLKGYDYSQDGYYFVTICVKNMENIFGTIENNEMKMNEYGKIINKQWLWLFNQYKYIQIDEFIVMPNHFHGIIQINDNSRIVGNGRDRSLRCWKIKPIPELIGAFKTTSSKLIHLSNNAAFKWQKSYYDRIIRDDDELNRIREYIINNPANWGKDEEISISNEKVILK